MFLFSSGSADFCFVNAGLTVAPQNAAKKKAGC